MLVHKDTHGTFLVAAWLTLLCFTCSGDRQFIISMLTFPLSLADKYPLLLKLLQELKKDRLEMTTFKFLQS